jgi:hypothetical protein
MNELEKMRCEEYSRAIFGKSVKNKELEDLVKGSASFEEFRIRVVHKCSNRNEQTKKIAARWQSTLVKPDAVPDANILLHMLESLAQKQVDLERKLREANADLLSRLQVLDAAATGQAVWRTNLEEIRDQIAVIRRNLAQLEEVPSRGGNGSK